MDERVQNALYYGLFTDTCGLSELRHPLDRDLAEINYDVMLIRKLKNSAITIDELDIISKALQNREIISGIGLFRAEPCDKNLLGFAADIAQQVVHIDCCVVYCLQPQGIWLSVRSCTREIMADEMAGFLCRGNGGGSLEKAGGFMSFKENAEILENQKPEVFLKSRVEEYVTHFNLIHAGNNDINFAEMKLYKKLPIPVGFVKSTDIFPSRSKITIRTLEGDVDTITSENLYLMIGIQEEVYPIKRERFEASYDVVSTPYFSKLKYEPTILNRITGERKKISSHAQICVPKNEKLVRAEILGKATKIFSEWDNEKYFSGDKGDWLVANDGSFDDCYIVKGDIFEISYTEM